MGQRPDGLHGVLGFHQRLDEVQAAALTVKLHHLERWNQKRQQLAALYDELLQGLPLITPLVGESRTHVYYGYLVRTAHRESLMADLAAQGIGSRASYAVPVPLEPAFRSLGYLARDVPIAVQLSGELLGLPMFPELTEEEVREVAEAVRAYFGRYPEAVSPTLSTVPDPSASRKAQNRSEDHTNRK
jgi:dTDP-4-amino-4,6-dideoxygalactose transaminase